MATDKQKRAAAIFVEKRGISVSGAMREAGYSVNTAKNPRNLTASDAWAELIEKALPDKQLLTAHKKLFKSVVIEHMVFPLNMDDDEIKALLRTVGCTVKKFKHGETATHVWFWSPDRGAQAKALKLAYELKGKLKQKIEHSGSVDGLFGTDALTITVVNSADDVEHNPRA